MSYPYFFDSFKKITIYWPIIIYTEFLTSYKTVQLQINEIETNKLNNESKLLLYTVVLANEPLNTHSFIDNVWKYLEKIHFYFPLKIKLIN